ncbi:MAG: imidazolonepropionase [Planctomycetota bacterium]|jgi:imidazolonepropionase
MTRRSIENIGELVVVPRGPVPGLAMARVKTISNAALILDEGRIAWIGLEADLDRTGVVERIDAGGGCVIPGLIDCHTHTVFAGTREGEFVKRLEGASYAEIAEAGGGIKTTVKSVRDATRGELVDLARPRLQRMLARGVTTVEIKSGYGLTVADEIKMLEAAGDLADVLPMDIARTYLAAHTIPHEFSGDPEGYLDVILAPDVLSRLQSDGLAEFCDVFCERTAFDVEQSRRVLREAAAFGLRSKLHADQITQIGASVLAGEVSAISADHLETIHEEGIAAMKQAGSVAVLLPGCSFFLGVEQAPARRILEADLPVAVATDYNPGSAMVESLPLVMGIACTQMKMTPTETLMATTANAAAAIGRQDRLGAIAVGMQADLVILDVPNHLRMMYEPGRDCTRMVIKAGEVVVDAS